MHEKENFIKDNAEKLTKIKNKLHTGISDDATHKQKTIIMQKTKFFVYPIKLILYYAGCRQRTDEL